MKLFGSMKLIGIFVMFLKEEQKQMYKTMVRKQENKPVRDDLASITAKIMGVSARYVRMVVNGERNNERIFECYMQLKEGKTKLIREIERVVKF